MIRKSSSVISRRVERKSSLDSERLNRRVVRLCKKKTLGARPARFKKKNAAISGTDTAVIIISGNSNRVQTIKIRGLCNSAVKARRARTLPGR